MQPYVFKIAFHIRGEPGRHRKALGAPGLGVGGMEKQVDVSAVDLEPLAAILYDLENGKPYLFVDQLMIYKQQTYQPPGSKVASSPLDVRFNLTGYLRQPGKASATQTGKSAPSQKGAK